MTRQRIAFAERKRRQALDDAIDSIAKQLRRARRHQFEASSVIFNLALFFLLAERDIQIAKLDALTHPDKWVRSLNARVILLTIHELDLNKVSGTDLQDALVASGAGPHDIATINQALRKARRAQSNAANLFKEDRKAVIAHRTKDAIEQLERINSLREMQVLKVAAEFYEAASELIAVLPATIQQVAGLRGLIAQITARRRI